MREKICVKFNAVMFSWVKPLVELIYSFINITLFGMSNLPCFSIKKTQRKFKTSKKIVRLHVIFPHRNAPMITIIPFLNPQLSVGSGSKRNTSKMLATFTEIGVELNFPINYGEYLKQGYWPFNELNKL